MDKPLQETGEAPPFELVCPEGAAEALIICDHASRAIPPEYDSLGLDETVLRRHIAWDIGAADVARRLAVLLDAPAVLCGTSRLVIDCNRPLDDPTSIPEVSDGVVVPGNQGLTTRQRELRARRHFQPYHGEIGRRLDAFAARGSANCAHATTSSPITARSDAGSTPSRRAASARR